MDKPQQDKELERVQVSAPSTTKPTTIDLSSVLPWVLGAVILLFVLGNSVGPTNSPKGRDAQLDVEYSVGQLPHSTADICADFGELAEEAMRFRQTGGAKQDLLAVIDTRGSQETRVLARSIVDDAFNSAVHSDPNMQAVSVLAFRAIVEEACANSG